MHIPVYNVCGRYIFYTLFIFRSLLDIGKPFNITFRFDDNHRVRFMFRLKRRLSIRFNGVDFNQTGDVRFSSSRMDKSLGYSVRTGCRLNLFGRFVRFRLQPAVTRRLVCGFIAGNRCRRSLSFYHRMLDTIFLSGRNLTFGQKFFRLFLLLLAEFFLKPTKHSYLFPRSKAIARTSLIVLG